MQLEPILLEAALRAVFGRILQALGAGIVRYELLIKLFAVLVLWIQTVLLLFPNVLQGTFIVSALAHVDKLVTWRLGWDQRLLLRQLHFLHLHLVLGVSDATCLHHA